MPVLSAISRGGTFALCLLGHMVMKIDRAVEGDRVRLALSGDLDRIHLAEVERLLGEQDEPRDRIVLDLGGVRLVDREAVGALARWQAEGVRLERCPVYVLQWLAQEQTAKPGAPRRRSE